MQALVILIKSLKANTELRHPPSEKAIAYGQPDYFIFLLHFVEILYIIYIYLFDTTIIFSEEFFYDRKYSFKSY